MKNFDDVCCGNIFLLYHLNIRLTVDKPMSYQLDIQSHSLVLELLF